MSKAFDRSGLQDITADLRAAGWVISGSGGAIEKTYRFTGFPAAMAFMAMVAPFAESTDHHPEWRNVYNRVEVVLTTHDADGVTAKDLRLAEHMEQVFGLLQPAAR